MKGASAHVTPFDVEYAARRAQLRPAPRRTATAEPRPFERSRGVERAVLGSVLLVFLAIAIPNYASYRRAAADTTVHGSMREVIVALESYVGSRAGGYEGADALALQKNGLRVGADQWLLVASLHDTYWVLGQARGSSGLWVRSSSDSKDRLIAAE